MPLKVTPSQWLLIAQWCVWLIPIACSVSRFAADVLLSITSVMFLVHVAWQRDFSFLQKRWVQLALILWAYVVLTSIGAENMEKAFGRSLAWLRFPVFAMALSFWVLQDARAKTRLIQSLSIAVGFMLIDTAIQYFAGVEILGYESIPADGSPRLTGPFSAPRVGIMLVWMCIPVVAYWLMQDGGNTRTGKPLLLGVAFALGFLTVVFMSGERMAMLLTGLGFVVAFFILPISKKLMIAVAIAGGLMMASLAYFNPGLLDRHIGSTSEVVGEFSGSDYGQIWISGWHVFQDYPVFGTGLRQFRELCPHEAYGSIDEAVLKQRCNQHTHNIYLEWLVETGVIGVSMFMLLLCLFWREAIVNFKALHTNPVFLGLVITLFIRLWPLASNTSFFTAWSAVPMWLVIGWMLALCHHASTEKRAS